MDKLPQAVQAISEDDLRRKCLEVIKRNPETAKMAISGHERGVVILVVAVMKDLKGFANPKTVRQEIVRCLKG